MTSMDGVDQASLQFRLFFQVGRLKWPARSFCMRGVTLLLAYAGDWDKSLFVKVISAALCVSLRSLR